jgi:hypothetical protein
VHDILKELDLDYALNEEKPHVPSPIYEYYDERMKEKSDRIAKMIIRCSLSVNMMRRFLSNGKNTEVLINSRYDGISGLGNHVKSLFDMAYKLKALGLDVSMSLW